MPVNKITASQFVSQLNQSILSRNSAHDVEVGSIPDVITEPNAQVLELQNDRVRTISQLILLDQSATFEDTDVDQFVKNEEIIRNNGGRSSGTIIFSRASAPTADLPVQRGYPIATQPDTASGETVIFVTTEAKTLTAVTASTFFNIETNRYELEVSVQATVAGTIGQVGPNRITRPLRTLVGFDNVYNRNRTSTVTDRETNNELIERYKFSIIGTQVASKSGLKLSILSNFQDAGNVRIVTPGNSLITRSGVNGNAIDAYITGAQSITRQDIQEFIGINQLIILDNQPVQNVVSVIEFIQSIDYEFVKDTTGISNSVRAQDAIRFLPTAASLPTVGGNLTINYNQNILIENIQNELVSNPDNIVGGQDILIRSGDEIFIIIGATLTVLSGFSFTTIKNAITIVLVDFINTFGLGDNVEESDLQAIVRNISGVDNFIFTILDRLGGSSVGDIIIELNEFARTSSGNINIT